MKEASNYTSVDVNSKTQNKRQPDEIITLPGGTAYGNLGAFRTDGVAIQLKCFSVREIEPPEADGPGVGDNEKKEEEED